MHLKSKNLKNNVICKLNFCEISNVDFRLFKKRWIFSRRTCLMKLVEWMTVTLLHTLFVAKYIKAFQGFNTSGR